MKKSTKIYIWAWAVALVFLVGCIVWPSHHDIASDPQKVGAIVNLRLPEVADYRYEDNSDRDTPGWDLYDYHVYFAEEISEECIAEMERRCVEDSEHWSKNEAEGYYLYVDSDGDGGLYEIGCAIFDDQVHVGYFISEDEGIIAPALLFLYIHILVIWGLVLLIIAIVKRSVMKQIREELVNK